ncbi:hypothetical protein NDU88_004570 [Pleurodeles waltl]|uniref:Uncharacterized protein n=1 Tax=Pleurodeles waltl TaxID=8319 RepID=A0AAV7QD02_PLEWA|nr:hypothetical protein NDU88_004570 [Pleurodeles waltl]
MNPSTPQRLAGNAVWSVPRTPSVSLCAPRWGEPGLVYAPHPQCQPAFPVLLAALRRLKDSRLALKEMLVPFLAQGLEGNAVWSVSRSLRVSLCVPHCGKPG